MQMFTEEEIGFSKVEGVGTLVLLKRVRTCDPYDAWYVVEQVEQCDGYRKRVTRAHTEFMEANDEYQKRLALMKARSASKCANA